MGNQAIINLTEAIDIAFSKIKTKNSESINFKSALGRILAQDVFSDMDMPPFNKSAMDGYACKREDLARELDVLEIIPAGKSPKHKIEAGQCSKIMTGAQVPEGADTVFMVEYSDDSTAGKVRFTGTKTSSNICIIGEDIQKGNLVLKTGTLIKPQHIAMLAAVACIFPEVYQKPKVGIISTGSELIEPGTTVKPSQIRNSNGHQLASQVEQCNCICNYYGIVKDDREVTFKTIEKACVENDVTIISGGVSVGDFDYVPLVIKELDFDILFSKLSVKPGKHTTFATKGNKYIIGLPGNPVSSFIQFELFAKPFLYKLMGHHFEIPSLPLSLSSDFKRRKTDREEFIPITINKNNEAETIKYNGSAHIHAYHEAFGVMNIPQGIDFIKRGEIVNVRPL